VNFQLVLIELFRQPLGATAQALRVKIDRKSVISLQRGQFYPKFRVEGPGVAPPHQSVLHGYASECLNTLSLTVFTQRNFVADFLQAKCDFTPKTAVLRFEPPLGTWGNVR